MASFEQELVLRRAVAAELRHGAVDEQRAAPHVIPLYVSVICAPPLMTIPTYITWRRPSTAAACAAGYHSAAGALMGGLLCGRQAGQRR